MENKSRIDNKKLSRVLFMSGFALLILFILIRLVFKAKGDTVTDMPTVGELTYNPKKIEEKSKMQQFEDQRMEKQRKEMGYEENNYTVPDFKDLTKRSERTTDIEIVKYEKENREIKRNEGRSVPENAKVNSVSKLGYQSAYFTTKVDDSYPEKSLTSSGNTSVVKKNPFGTISKETNTQNKSISLDSDLYYKGEVYGDQKIENGGYVIIRNTEAFQFSSISIPKNSILYGQASFSGNRVKIKISRIKTLSGEFTVNLYVLDNDRLEGIYYKAPIDETVDKTKEDMSLPEIPGAYGGVLNSVAERVIGSGKDLMKRKASLNLAEGYKLFITSPKNN